MWSEFKAFLLKQNILALAIAFVVGLATNDLVKAIVDDFIMPVIGAVAPGETWEAFEVPVWRIRFRVGHFASALLNFFIIGFVAWRLTKIFIAPPKADEKPATRPCPFCKQMIDATATRCAYCTSELAQVA